MNVLHRIRQQTHACVARVQFVECQGTDHGFHNRFASRPQYWLSFYRNMYENCTTVTTNLEIVHLNPGYFGSGYDLSFFENIREVHGYVLVALNLVSRVPLTSLRVIRGLVQYVLPPRGPGSNTLEEEDGVGFSLYVAANSYRSPDGSESGLRVLELPALRGTDYS